MQLATDDVSLCFLIILQCKAQNVSLKGMPSPAIPILQAAGRTCSSTEPLGAPSDCRRDTKKNKTHKSWDCHLNAVMYVHCARLCSISNFNISEHEQWPAPGGSQASQSLAVFPLWFKERSQ